VGGEEVSDWPKTPVTPGTIYSLSERELLQRAVRNARDRNKRKGVLHPRWAAVMDAFSLGSTYAKQLCAHFDLDPHERVKR
jgi:hypothetical protein